MAGRFITVPILKYIEAPLILGIYGTGAIIFAVCAATIGGTTGGACLFMVFFFESAAYPVVS